MECKWDAALLHRSEQLPTELLQIIQHGSNAQYLNAITQASLDPRFTYIIFAHCEDIFPHICATLRSHGGLASSVATLGRVVPFAPYLKLHAQHLVSDESYSFSASGQSNDDLLYLLGLFRLFSYDPLAFRPYVKATEMSRLLESQSRPIVYLAIRILQIFLAGADHWFEQMVKRYLGGDTPESSIDGQWDDTMIDYRFLTLWEEDRFRKFAKLIDDTRSQLSTPASGSRRTVPENYFDQSTASVGGILLPRAVTSAATISAEDDLVYTPTIKKNLHKIAHALKSPRPLLLTGVAGSGKTLLTRHVAAKLGSLDNMITLHLNEQSDAKILIGVYTTGQTPGSFVWKPGVLTQAVQDGRWVLIEDLDRAPNEVIGTLLPLIERGELTIPNRKHTIYAAAGFRIFATIRTTINHRGEETKPMAHMLGARHWCNINIVGPNADELSQVALHLCPSLSMMLPQFISVYERLQVSRQRAVLVGQSKTGILRAIDPRDFLKWCSRVMSLMNQRHTFTSNDMDGILLEAVDCFVGAIPDGPARSSMIAVIAEELRIDPQRRDYLVSKRDTIYEVSKARISVGRYSLPHSQEATKPSASYESFSTNPHTCRMLERVAATVINREPLLLVGETGVGKTTAVQHLARQLGKKLVPFNLSQQSEAGDLLGGFKPVNARSIVIPLKDEFDKLFAAGFSRSKNQQFLDLLGKQMTKSNWRAVCKLWRQALKMVDNQRSAHSSRQGEAPSKKRKVDSKKSLDVPRWEAFAAKVSDLEHRLGADSHSFAFSFVEGTIVKAVRNGDWILLDEINLASPDTLESIADLFVPHHPSVLLTESGSTERVNAHPDFRVFAAMNPATDVGKKDLTPGIRSRFTELYVESPDRDLKSLQSIVKSYLRREAVNDQAIALDVSTLYQKIMGLSERNQLVDGASQKPHFSLRTLTRTLSYARYIAPLCSLRRALYEGFHMSFLTFLDAESSLLVEPLLQEHILGKRTNIRGELSRSLRMPDDGAMYVQGYPGSKHWIRQGNLDIEEQPQYILTPFIRRNLENLVRASSTRQFPVLIQGPTSSGKTSMIEYLAKRSGHKFVRINNHEHTDLQEYLGTYISGADGRLQFQEGVLVKALREGHWIVLDELNLAPTDVLEALNRLLDDNRELLVPETQETIRPHGDFMLFATQNPAGLYGGRKTLSRAFRNRFLELHFDDIPIEELQDILHKRTQLPESRCKRIVGVYRELSVLRQESRMFEQRSFATLRDLFRWALRPNDTIEQLAANGFMLLAERVRKPEERATLKEVIEKVMSLNGPRIRIDEDALYASDCAEVLQYQNATVDSGIVWTKAMRRLYCLVARAIRNNEPVLLVGETGCGKTTVCQMLAKALENKLHMVNAHQNTETGDIIGSQRPVRNRAAIEAGLRHQLLSSNLMQTLELAAVHSTEALLDAYDRALGSLSSDERGPYERSDEFAQIQARRTRFNALFEWADGSLVEAMKGGNFFLLDEISLADDSVLERINSVLETQRSILLAEKGSLDSYVTASPGFQFFATMNPGGDYGKRELSPALRNRFTEIWVPPLGDVDDIAQIVSNKLTDEARSYAEAIVAFSRWFNGQYNTSATSSVSIRDTLSWVSFVNTFPSQDLGLSIMHGAAMVYIDTLGANPAGLMTMSTSGLDEQRKLCVEQLCQLLQVDVRAAYYAPVEVDTAPDLFHSGPFSLQRRAADSSTRSKFSFEPPTTKSNAMRVVRAMQLSKPVLLEGNPGVGKTALVIAIANAVCVPLTRINLSEQTDLLDLFGSDVPAEDSSAGAFMWRDAPFLRAMKNGEWVLLDEMNLASQSVLEGLNACLDHRGEVFVPELGQTFVRHPDFRLFAAQNPHHQGGGRKGLPASFVNRFSVVFVDAFRSEDLALISRRQFPSVATKDVEKIIAFIQQLDVEVVQHKRIGANGGPWEFNLRDVSRWLSLVASEEGLLRSAMARDFVEFLFAQRFRLPSDRAYIRSLFDRIFDDHQSGSDLFPNISTHLVQVGIGALPRHPNIAPSKRLQLLAKSDHHLAIVQSTMLCIQQNWPVILTGAAGVGKSAVIDRLAAAVGAEVTTIALNADSDAIDLIGGFEQVDPRRQASQFLQMLQTSLNLQAKDRLMYRPSAELLAACETDDYGSVRDALSRIQSSSSPLEANQVSEDLKLLEGVQHALRETNKAQFEWMDGVLVDALQQGKWLVLDNANLCSPSVLDRLNSLLEPNGTLMINEHSADDGSPRIIRPHPSFRVFLTYDPRYGELSRAMRNRAVELHLPKEGHSAAKLGDPLHPESAVARFRCAEVLDSRTDSIDDSADAAMAFADHTAFSDVSLSRRLLVQLKQGLFEVPESTLRCLAHIWPVASQAALQSTAALDEPSGAVPAQTQASADFQRVQTFHPLNNQALISGSQTLLFHAFSVTYVYEILAQSSLALAVLNAIKRDSSLVATIRRLERSFGAESTLPSSKVKGSVLLAAIEESLHAVLGISKQIALPIPEAIQLKRHTTSLISIWKVLLQYFNTPSLDAPTLETYGISARSLLQSQASETPPAVVDALAKIWTYTGAVTDGSNDHQYGACIALWNALRPETPTTNEQLEALLNLEAVVERFDTLCHRFDNPIGMMADLRLSFVRALTSSTRGYDMAELSQKLENAMVEYDVLQQNSKASTETHFLSTFRRTLEQFAALSLSGWTMPQRDLAMLETFALQGTKSSILFEPPAERPAQGIFHLLRIIVSPLTALETIQYQGSSTLMNELDTASNASLARMQLLEDEVLLLGRTVTSQAHHLCLDTSLSLKKTLGVLVHEVLTAFSNAIGDAGLQEPALQLLGRMNSPECRSSNGVINSAIAPVTPASAAWGGLEHVVGYLTDPNYTNEPDSRSAANAWATFSAACLQLYIPVALFDPALDHRFRRDVHQTTREHFDGQLRALRTFRNALTGNVDTLRVRILEEDIAVLGQGPSAEAVHRPSISRFSELKGDLDALMRLLDSTLPARTQEFPVLPLSASNIANIIRIRSRLLGNYRDYEDFWSPIVGYLDCLLLAHILAMKAEGSESEQTAMSQLNHLIPFVGASWETWRQEHVFLNTIGALRTWSDKLDWLEVVATRSSILQPDDSSELRSAVEQVFEQFYLQWKAELQDDQEKTAVKSSLYKFRGQSDHDEEPTDEELDELFPREHSRSAASKNGIQSRTAQNAAHRVANLHSKVFGSATASNVSILGLLAKCSVAISKDQSSDGVMPTVVRKLAELQAELSASNKVDQRYNIYKDTNTAQVKALVNIINKVIRRFRSLRELFPEQAPLTDVLRLCEALLDLPQDSPLAAMFPQVEQLHKSITQWQTVASREHGVVDILDDMSNLIINWRQLELSSWAGLFDNEFSQCEKDAASWWYIAYESIIAPISTDHITDSDRRQDNEELLGALSGFLTASGLGEYRARLDILRGFEAHLERYRITRPNFGQRYQALQNFNAYHSHFLPKVEEDLASGRAGLEKDIKNIIQVASWKDRNIEVLNRSAKSSHNRLIRLVRKFRALLARPVASVVSAGVPGSIDLEKPVQRVPTHANEAHETPVNVAQLSKISAWTERPPRFKHVGVTTSNLYAKTAQAVASINLTSQLKSFTTGLEQSIIDLQKATPPVLTEENKALVSHLKNRKRRLLAEVLRDMRKMGFQPSVSDQVVSRQASTSVVFSRLASLSRMEDLPQLSSAEHAVHRFLGVMPTARESARKHSDDLTPAETARCMSLLESVLENSIAHHQVTAKAVDDMIPLRKHVQMLRNFGDSSAPSSGCSGFSIDFDVSHQASMLKLVMSAARDILRQQEALSNNDYTTLIDAISHHETQLTQLISDAEQVPILPTCIHTDADREMSARMDRLVNDLQVMIESAVEIHPETRPIVVHILRWTPERFAGQLNSYTNGHSDVARDQWSHSLFEMLDSILVRSQAVARLTADLRSDQGVGYLMEQQKTVRELTNALGIGALTADLSRLLSQLSQIQPDPDGSLAEIALLTNGMLPIVDAYYNSVVDFLDLCLDWYTQLNRTGHMLATSFIRISQRGFCTPSEKEQDGSTQAGDLESGTGLGDGEGAEDISKDIADDEDMSELVQRGEQETQTEGLEDQKDAVDMADEEFEGELGDVPAEPDGSDGEDDDADDETSLPDEQAGDGDLGPDAVDEKMWDEGSKEDKPDKEADTGKGTSDNDQNTAGADQTQEAQDQELDKDLDAQPDEVSAQEVDTEQQQPDQLDPHTNEESNLDLPDDMNMDQQQQAELSDSDLDSVGADQEPDEEAAAFEPADDVEDDGNMQTVKEDDALQQDEVNEQLDAEAAAEAVNEDQNMEQDNLLQEQQQARADPVEETADIAEDGSGPDKANTGVQQSALTGNTEDVTEETQALPEDETGAGTGTRESQDGGMETTIPDPPEDRSRSSFKRLGDILEEWYDQHRDIEAAQPSEQIADTERQDAAGSRFEHVPDDTADADAQALGAASMDQSAPIDRSNAISGDDNDQTPRDYDRMSEDLEKEAGIDQDEDVAGQQPENSSTGIKQSSTFVGEPGQVDNDVAMADEIPVEDVDDVDDVDERMTNTHLHQDEEEEEQVTIETAQQLWAKHEESTRNLALVLTEHLRLILHPTQATRMRGDFRTGKRLNIKRIIPYIASSYKRDKIWMRRSVPSKRSYQVMLAIDDSKSMAESQSHELAFETLALVAKSMSMLEVGELSIVGFGEHVNVAHDFSMPFTSDSGSRILQRFRFSQSRTDVQTLLRETIELFRAARLKAAGSASDLWQLQLIISDGICEDHPAIRQLIRQAHEERIMVVFIVVDHAESATGNTAGSKQSILDLQTAEFVKDAAGEMQLKMTKYLDTFPFRYYLIVRDVQELPGVLAGALRQWFAEAVETGR